MASKGNSVDELKEIAVNGIPKTYPCGDIPDEIYKMISAGATDKWKNQEGIKLSRKSKAALLTHVLATIVTAVTNNQQIPDWAWGIVVAVNPSDPNNGRIPVPVIAKLLARKDTMTSSEHGNFWSEANTFWLHVAFAIYGKVAAPNITLQSKPTPPGSGRQFPDWTGLTFDTSCTGYTHTASDTAKLVFQTMIALLNAPSEGVKKYNEIFGKAPAKDTITIVQAVVHSGQSQDSPGNTGNKPGKTNLQKPAQNAASDVISWFTEALGSLFNGKVEFNKLSHDMLQIAGENVEDDTTSNYVICTIINAVSAARQPGTIFTVETVPKELVVACAFIRQNGLTRNNSGTLFGEAYFKTMGKLAPVLPAGYTSSMFINSFNATYTLSNADLETIINCDALSSNVDGVFKRIGKGFITNFLWAPIADRISGVPMTYAEQCSDSIIVHLATSRCIALTGAACIAYATPNEIIDLFEPTCKLPALMRADGTQQELVNTIAASILYALFGVTLDNSANSITKRVAQLASANAGPHVARTWIGEDAMIASDICNRIISLLGVDANVNRQDVISMFQKSKQSGTKGKQRESASSGFRSTEISYSVLPGNTSFGTGSRTVPTYVPATTFVKLEAIKPVTHVDLVVRYKGPDGYENIIADLEKDAECRPASKLHHVAQVRWETFANAHPVTADAAATHKYKRSPEELKRDKYLIDLINSNQ